MLTGIPGVPVSVRILAQSTRPAGIGCPNDNPFIKHMLSMSMLNTPDFTPSPICAFEFSKYGTCCPTGNVEPEARNDYIHHTGKVNRLKREFKEFVGVLSKVYDLIKRIALAPKHPWRNDWNGKIDKAREFFNNPSVNQYFSKHLNANLPDAATFEKEIDECWNAQVKVRNLALCFTCSGR